MLTNCNTWRMRIVLLIGRQLKASRGSKGGGLGGGEASGTCHSVNGNLNYSSFFYDFHFFSISPPPSSLTDGCLWLALRTQLN